MTDDDKEVIEFTIDYMVSSLMFLRYRMGKPITREQAEKLIEEMLK